MALDAGLLVSVLISLRTGAELLRESKLKIAVSSFCVAWTFSIVQRRKTRSLA